MKKGRKIVPIHEAAAAGEVLKQFGVKPDEEAPFEVKPPGDLPFLIRLRFSPVAPGLLIGLGALLMITGLIDGIYWIALPGAALLMIGIVWFMRQRLLYRFALRSGGSSPRNENSTDPPDDYNDSIVTRG